jgi:hypothetical protein
MEKLTGSAIRTATLAIAAVISIQQIPSVHACYTCEWSASDGYRCIPPIDEQFYCYTPGGQIPCRMSWCTT